MLFRSKSFILSSGRYNILDAKIVNIIQWLDENGWEIGVHGSYNSFKDIKLLAKEKKILENIVKHDIIGIRQHYLNLNSKTWEIQYRTGFKFDSSLGSNENIGFVDNRISPFQPLNNEFTVFPQVIMDFCYINTINVNNELDKIFDICEKNNAILVINFHNNVFNEMEFPGYKKAFIDIIEKCKARNANFKTLKEFYLESNKPDSN